MPEYIMTSRCKECLGQKYFEGVGGRSSQCPSCDGAGGIPYRPDSDEVECVCGNMPHLSGFFPVEIQRDGRVLYTDPHPEWDGLLICDSNGCERMFYSDGNGEVVYRRDPTNGKAKPQF